MARDVLTAEDARRRSRVVTDLAYSLGLRLEDAPSGHRGRTRIACTVAARSGEPVWLDFAGVAVDAVRIDGRLVPVDWDGCRLHLPRLPPGRRLIEVHHGIAPTGSGAGLLEAVDAVDGRRYLGTMFEPFGAHRVFPCFDQPDLKAAFRVGVRAPAEWTVMSNGPARSSRRVGQGQRTSTFGPVGPISPYVVAVLAGPFHRVRRRVGNLPVSYAARASRSGLLDGEVGALHELLRSALPALERYFDHPMPFPKLDHVFVPGFHDGAMENAGAVALEESFLLGSGASASQVAARAEIVVHELVHMWLGNLVSVGWWNDLWLKESLATYLAFVILEETGIVEDPWVWFEAGRKEEALDDDRRSTSHPVVATVPDTDAALVAGDDIAYGKGAAVLHQLAGMIGPNVFRSGLRALVAERAWRTASLDDLLMAWGNAAGQDLKPWSLAWLESRSLDTIAVTVDRKRRSATVTVRRPPGSEGAHRREHRLQVSVIYGRPEGGAGVGCRPVTLAEAVTVQLPGETTSLVVLPDGSGHAYARIRLDASSVPEVWRLLGSIDLPLHRQLVWNGVWELVRDGELPAREFLENALDMAPHERCQPVAVSLLLRVRTILSRWTAQAPSPARSRALDLGLTEASRPGAPLARPWLRLAVQGATTASDISRLARVLESDEVLHRAASASLHWDLAVRAAAQDLPVAEVLATCAAQMDPDASAEGMAAVAAARPEEEGKARVWERICAGDEDDPAASELALRAFFRPEQLQLVSPYVDRYFDLLETSAQRWPIDRALTFVEAAFPGLADLPAVLARAPGAVELLQSVASPLARPLADAAEDLALDARLRSLGAG